ncbi:MAG: fused MFS/spermidine synthase [Flavobacteriales bacterium]|nr:fused MFS/spermidine synthase [Flavobacteriales bacterium]
MLRRYFSFLWPTLEERVAGRHGELTVRWEAGSKVLNSEQGNQSFGALHRVWQDVFAHLDLASTPPRDVLLLGLGGGSVPTILREELGIGAPITAVELDPAMVELARRHFGLTRHRDMQVVIGDATIQVHAMRARFHLVLVDLFDDLDLARGVDARTFIHGLRDRCAEGGIVCFNTVAYDEASDKRCQAVYDHASRIFNRVNELRSEGMNRVFICNG